MDEILDLHDQFGGVGHLREDVEGVEHGRVLHQRRLLAGPPQPLAVPLLPVPQRVETPHEHQRRREPLQPRHVHRVRAAHVRRPVVPVRPLRQEGLPANVRPGHRHQRRIHEPGLRFGPLRAPEEGLDQHQPHHPDSLEPLLLRPAGPHRHVVRDVRPGAVPGEEALGDVGDPGQRGGLVEEAEDVEAVVVLGGEPVLGGEAVVDGDDDGGELAGEATAHGVVGPGGRAEEAEAAAVEEDEDGEGGGGGAGGGGGGGGRGVEAEPEAAGGVDGDVGGGDAVGGGGVGGGLEVEEAYEAAVDGAVGAAAVVGEAGEEGDGDASPPGHVRRGWGGRRGFRRHRHWRGIRR